MPGRPPPAAEGSAGARQPDPVAVPPTEPDLAWDNEPPILEFAPPLPESDRSDPEAEGPVAIPIPLPRDDNGDESPTVITKMGNGERGFPAGEGSAPGSGRPG
ncbi:MAG TPA: hypothetical protein VKE74_05110, partial [Gemmataceae bacterium]|nr:hypothetical protein [Gemmataceae bacterium]